MYATRPLSLYREDPNELSWLAPAEAHGSSGYLFITDNEEEGSVVLKDGKGFLFPNNKFVNVVYRKGVGYYRGIEWEKVWFIPVPDQPMSANRYYVIKANGRHKGQAITCSREEDMGTCFCSKYIKDINPIHLNHTNIYQTIKILEQKHGGFVAKSVTPNGIPPGFLRGSSGWSVYKSDSKLCQLSEASGLNFSLRNLLPDLNFPMRSQNSSPPVTIGKWYCPAVFIRDGDLRHQMENSLFYEMTLEQFWEAIYTWENDDYAPTNVLVVSTSVKKETLKLFGMEATMDDTDHGGDGMQWVRNELNNTLGLNIAIVEKMKWIQEKGGFIGGGEKESRVEHVEELKEGNHAGWARFGCFVLVERFVLKTMSGVVVFTCDYKHIHQLQSKWE